MTRDQYLDELAKAGFSYKSLWSAKEQGERFDNVRAYVIYAPSGMLLTSVILRTFEASGVNATPEVAAYFCSENVSMAADLDDLKAIWSHQLKRRNAGRA